MLFSEKIFWQFLWEFLRKIFWLFALKFLSQFLFETSSANSLQSMQELFLLGSVYWAQAPKSTRRRDGSRVNWYCFFFMQFFWKSAIYSVIPLQNVSEIPIGNHRICKKKCLRNIPKNGRRSWQRDCQWKYVQKIVKLLGNLYNNWRFYQFFWLFLNL